MKKLNVGLDIDGVLANFCKGVIDAARREGQEYEYEWTNVPCWDFMPYERWSALVQSDEFWFNLEPLPYSGPLHFTPACYITARKKNSWLTAKWLGKHGFPCAEVITVTSPFDKLQHIKERGLDLFVDDHWETIRQLRENGVNGVLYEAPYQKGHDISDLPVMKSLKEIEDYV